MPKENNDVINSKNGSEAVAKKPLFVIPEVSKKDLAEENKRLEKENQEYQKRLEERVDNGFYPLIRINDHLMESVRNIEKLINSRGGFQPEDILTGFADLDRLTNGFHLGEYIVLASRPGVGKSALGL